MQWSAVILVILFSFIGVRAPIVAPTLAFHKVIIVRVHRCRTIATCLVIQMEPLTDTPNVLEGIVAA
jgi:hypothetical protein